MSAGHNARRHHGRVRCGKAAEPGIWRRPGDCIRCTLRLDCLRRAQPASQSVWRILTVCRWRVRPAISPGTEAQPFRCQASRDSGVRSAIATSERIRAGAGYRREAIRLWHASLRTACSTGYDITFRSTCQGIRYTGIWTAFAAGERSCFRSTLSTSRRLHLRPTLAAE